MLLCNLSNRRITHWIALITRSEWTVARRDNIAQNLCTVNQIDLSEIWIDFNLIDCRWNSSIGQHIQNTLNIKV
ncbi:hypothetical protein D3C80_1792980 [compost metagenome]